MRLIAACLVLAAVSSAYVTISSQEAPSGSPGVSSVPRAQAEMQLATLLAHDPLASSLGLADGAPGGVVQDHMAKNRSNDLEFGGYYPDALAVGFEGGSEGAIVDLGSRGELQERYGYAETIGLFQGFTSIRRQGGSLVILADYEKQTTQALSEARALFDGTAPDHAAVHLGHVYLVRITKGNDEELLAKLLVVSHEPESSVTIRWQLLSSE